MKKQNDNLFLRKFDLLNSQDNTDDIRWSSSESSDYENVSSNVPITTSKSHNRKRKRKKIISRNLSNLNISIVDVPELKTERNLEKSPVLVSKRQSKPSVQSPILKPTEQRLPSFKCAINTVSPILNCRPNYQVDKLNVKERSPVLILKYKPPRISSTVKKKLFEIDKSFSINKNESSNSNVEEKHNKYSNKKVSNSPKNKVSNDHIINKLINNNDNCDTNLKSYSSIACNLERISRKEIESNFNLIKSTKESSEFIENSITKESTVNLPQSKTKLDLVKSVQSYFDCNFSSGSTSQQSISECEKTPQNTSKSSEDIEIVSSMTQARDSSQLAQGLSALATSESCETNIDFEKSKKVKYKKVGLANRLSVLLKKQNANISLWQHEKFLANNSNFVIPKSEHILFRIQKVDFKYGSYLLESIDLKDERYLIIINEYYVNSNCNIPSNGILKLYEPYKILDLVNYCKVVVNVCKFECVIV